MNQSDYRNETNDISINGNINDLHIALIEAESKGAKFFECASGKITFFYNMEHKEIFQKMLLACEESLKKIKLELKKYE
jgi:hypothetical protein